MSPARIAAIILLVAVSSSSAGASGGNYRPPGARPLYFVLSTPVIEPNDVAYRIAMVRNSNLSAPAAARQFRFEPGEDALSAARPGGTKTQRFSFPRVFPRIRIFAGHRVLLCAYIPARA